MDRSAVGIVILHEDLITGIRVTAMLDRLFNEADTKSHREIWKYDSLRHHTLWDQAAAADMTVISAFGNSELPDHIKDWVETVLFQKQSRPPSVLVLLDWQPETINPGEPSALSLYLREQTMKYGVDFLCNTCDWRRTGEAGPVYAGTDDDRWETREISFAGVQHWGIND